MRRLFAVLCALAATAAGADVRLRSAMEVQLGSTIGQMRAVPVQTGRDAAPAFLLVYGPDVVVDPYHEMFFYPAGTLNLPSLATGGSSGSAISDAA